MHVKESENRFYAYLLFFIWPFLSLWFAFKNYTSAWAKNLVWFFTAFYGYTFVILEGSTTDATRYVYSFQKAAQEGMFRNLINSLYTKEELDIFQPIIEYLISRFTDNYHIYFLVIGLIFGYFLSRNIWFLLERAGHKLFKVSLIIIIVYSFIIPFWQIGGYRWAMAMHIFLFGVFHFFVLKRKRGLIIAIFSFFVHFSFLVPISALVIYLLMRNTTFIYFVFFIFSFALTEISGDLITGNSLLPDIFIERAEGYTNQEYIEKKIKEVQVSNWYVGAYNKALRYTTVFLIFLLYFKGRDSAKKEIWLFNLFNFTILFYAIANMISENSSAGRFLALANMLTLAVTFFIIQMYQEKGLMKVLYGTIPFLLFFLIVKIRIGYDTIGITTMLGNPIFALFMEDDVALINLIK